MLVILWFRTGAHDPHHRPGSFPYSAGYLVSAVLFAASAAFEGPVTYWLWAVALAAQVIGPIVGMHRWTPPVNQAGEAIIATTPSLVERMGEIAIIRRRSGRSEARHPGKEGNDEQRSWTSPSKSSPFSTCAR